MEKLRAYRQVSFSTKVVVPIISVMVLLLVISAYTVNQRLTRQFHAEAARNLATADAVFRNSHQIHTKYLLMRFHKLPYEPRYRAAFLSGHVPTLRDQIKDIPVDQDVDVALFISTNAEVVASAKRDLLIPMGEFETNSATAIRQSLRGEEKVDTIRAGERLFDVVSIPVLGNSEEPIGVLAFGTEIADKLALEFSTVTHSQIVLLANGRVIASTVAGMDSQAQFAGLFRECTGTPAQPRRAAALKEVLLGDEHYFCSAGKFTSLGGDNTVGYLLLTSYEQPLRALHLTQEMLLAVSGLGILLSTTIIWFLVRRVTAPLRALRSSAEAVGRGDFSARVAVTSGDECGELAEVFNRMTQNLQVSREELEKTVHTLKTTQAQLVQSEKLSGIGEFVAGVAHELNNPLTSVMGFSELLKQADKNPQNQRHLDYIHKSAVRCQKIVQNLLSFARRHAPERKPSSVNALIETAVEFLQYQLRTGNIQVVTCLDAELPKAMVDPHQVQQVFLNIINNARQAIEAHQPGGSIHITSERVEGKAQITFRDTGPGIPEENLSRVFDPFFTTKEAGKGTGLGLSLCYGIITEHGGTITVRSKRGEGATFIIELPLATETNVQDAPRQMRASTIEEKKTVAMPHGVAVTWGSGVLSSRGVQVKEDRNDVLESATNALQREGQSSSLQDLPVYGREGLGKRVLIIDDEEAILQMMREMLTNQGFEVDIARDGESALERMKQTSYDLVLCDWKMPGLNGQQVYERLRAFDPQLSEHMIFITGDVISDRTQKFLAERKKICLPKPFSLSDFRMAVDEALTAGRSAAVVQ